MAGSLAEELKRREPAAWAEADRLHRRIGELAEEPARAEEHATLARAERAGCKTVGSAYVGSNLTPATTCENATLAANSRANGAFLLCPGVSPCRAVDRHIALSTDA